MNRVYIFILLLFFFYPANSQTQQGVVKTRGRVVNGQVVPGTRLNGATVTLNIGNPLVSGQNGAFSFNVPTGKNYSLVAAKKQGYTLADPEYTRRSFKYSASNPFFVVMEDEAQRQADINAATRKVRRTLTAQLQKREDEIEALRAQNKLTEAEYQKRLQELYDNQSKSEQLVKEMAERYISTDYDQLDEFNRQVQMYIEEGELQKADSMIRSKGNMEQRVAEYHSVVAANKKVREELEQSESGAARTYEDLSQDLLRKSEIFLQAYQQDSALYCMKVRADLDTTNVRAVWQYAYLCSEQNKFADSEKYYHICLRACLKGNDIPRIAVIQNSLGVLYMHLHDYTNSEKYYKLALENREQLFRENPDAYRADLASTQNNLGHLYYNLHDYTNSEKYYKLAFENYEKLFRENPEAYRADLASTQDNLGVLYDNLHDYTNSEKYYKLALENREQLFRENPDAYRADLADTQNNLGILYYNLHDYANSEKYYKLALENREQLFRENPDAYRTDLARTQNNLGKLYCDVYDYANSEKYYKLALENKEQLLRENPDAYRADLARTQNNLGFLYYNLHDYANSEKYYKLALENHEQLFRENPNVYRADLASTYWGVILLYADTNNIEEYDKYLEKSLILYAELYKLQPSIYVANVIILHNRKVWRMLQKGDADGAMKLALETYAMDETNDDSRYYLAQCHNEKAYAYTKTNDFPKAIETIDQAMALMPTDANLYDSKGEILLMQGKNEEALAMWKKVLEFNPDFLKDYPDGTGLSNGLKKLGLIE